MSVGISAPQMLQSVTLPTSVVSAWRCRFPIECVVFGRILRWASIDSFGCHPQRPIAPIENGLHRASDENQRPFFAALRTALSGLFGGRSEGQLRVTNLYRTAIQQALQCTCVRLSRWNTATPGIRIPSPTPKSFPHIQITS